jgi:hypothetical protein
MEHLGTVLKYSWTLINEYKSFKSSGIDTENQIAALMAKAIVKYLTDYIGVDDGVSS